MKEKTERFYGWIALGAVALSIFMIGGAGYTFSAFLPALNAEFGWPVGEISIALSLMMGLMTLCSPAAGFFVGKFGARVATVLGNALISVSFLMLALHMRQWQLHVAYALMGVGCGIGGLVAAGSIASAWFVRKAPLAMSINMAAMALGGLAFAPLSVFLIRFIGWRQTYLVLGGLVLGLGAVLPGLLIRNRPEDLGQVADGVASSVGSAQSVASVTDAGSESAGFTVKEAMRTKAFWLLCLFGCTPNFIMVFVMAHQINFLTRGIGLSGDTAGVAMGLISGTGLLGTLGMGLLALKFDVRRLTVLAAGLIILGMFLGSITHGAPLAMAYSILIGIGMGASLVSLMSLVPAYFGRAEFSKILGIAMLFGILGALGAPIGGYIYDVTKSYNLAFVAGMGAGLIGMVLMLLVRPPLRPRVKPADTVRES